MSRAALLNLFILLFSASILCAAQARLFEPDDLFRLEEVGEAAFSPDGRWVAYVRIRPASEKAQHKRTGEGTDRADIWVAPADGGQPRNITNGAADGSGFGFPIWSPDSQRLAMLSTKGGNLRVWVWERATGLVRQVTERGTVDTYLAKPVWLSDLVLACAVLAEGQKPLSMNQATVSPETAMKEWPKAWKGRETTASVLDSGVPTAGDKRPQGQLLFIDVTTRSQKVVAEGDFAYLRLSPDGRQLAFLKRIGPRRLNGWHTIIPRYHLCVASADGRMSRVDMKNLNVVDQMIRWSPDSKHLGVFATEGADEAVPAHAYSYAMGDSGLTRVLDKETAVVGWWEEGYRFRSFILDGDRLLLPMTPEKARGQNRSDWWVVEKGDSFKRNLTQSLPSAPADLLRMEDRRSLVGLSDGELWRFRTDGVAPPQNITQNFVPKVSQIVWPSGEQLQTARLSHVVIEVRHGTESELYRVDLSSDHLAALSKPVAEARLIDFSPGSGAAVWTANTREGTYLWLTRKDIPKPYAVVETNLFLREIAEGQLRKIDYRSTDGKQLKGWIILPVNYQAGKRYPMVVWVYLGLTQGDALPRGSSINYASPFNLQLLAAHGYTVLLPSMPGERRWNGNDPYSQLSQGVLPAVEKAIEMGIADPERVGVMGHSWGGYSTYGLVTQTNRFKAAVAMAGSADFMSLFGTFYAKYRYTDAADDNPWRMLRSGGYRGNPPWRDTWRYMRNSPLSYVDRVETPLLIIQGDMDSVPIEQGEQFFTSLYRQNKRARFVRYWGEDHVIESQANVRDMWQRIYAWFDEFLLKGKADLPTSDRK